MYLAYLDSSGRPSFVDKENFVLACVITSESHWQSIENGMKKIKLKHFSEIADTDVEFHAKDMVNREGIFKTIDWDKTYAILDDIFDLIADPEPQITIIGVVIDKSKLHQNKDIEMWAHRLMLERISRFVERKNEQLIEEGNPSQYGIMICDSEGEKKDARLRRKLAPMLRDGTLYCDLEYLIEDPLFTNSKWRNLSQLVDCVAYCIRKKYRTNTPSIHTTKWDEYFPKLTTKLDSPRGSYGGYGLKVFP